MRSKLRFLLVALPIALAVGAAVVIFAARSSLHRAAATAALGQRAAFTLAPFDPVLQAAANPGFEPVSPASSYTAGAVLAGDFYLAGPNGLQVVSAGGTPVRTLRTGIELPSQQITAVAAGRLRGMAEPQILLATAGAGLLLVTPGPSGAIRQLLPAAAAERDLTALLPLATGDLLLGTRHHGALVFNGASLTPFRPAVAGVNADTLEVTALAAPDSTSFLIGTRNAGLLYAHAGVVLHADMASGMPDDQVVSLAVTSATAYAGTPLGIAQFALGSGAEAFRPQRILAPGTFANALSLSTATQTIGIGTLDIGTLDQGVQRLPLSTQAGLHRVSIAAPAEPTDAASGQRVDAFLDGGFALRDGVLVRRTAAGWSDVTPGTGPAAPSALADRNVSALAFGPTGELYVGFFDHGLDILDPEGSQPPRHLEDDHLFCVNRLVFDPARQAMAAATANGLVLFDGQGHPRQTLTRRDGLLSDHISDIAFTPQGLALATPAGITFMTARGAESLYGFQGLVNNHVYTLAADAAHNSLLAGTLGGLSLLTGEAVTRNLTATTSALAHNWVTALARLPNGATLVGTYGAGLQWLSAGGAFSPVDLPPGVPRDLVINPNALLVTPTHMYAGTLSHGLLVYTIADNRWTAVTRGLPSANVTAFAARDGMLYVGTENGLVRIPEARL